MKKVTLLVSIFFVFVYCKNSSSSSQPNNIPPSGKTGEELAHLHCGNCHQYPEPSLLDKNTWASGVLPNMGARLGIKTNHDPYLNITQLDKMMIEAENIYPSQPLISQEDWEKIVAFYKKSAPESLPLPAPQQQPEELKGFAFKRTNIAKFPPLVTLVKINEAEKRLNIGTFDGTLSYFTTSQNDLTFQKIYMLPSTPVGVYQPKNEKLRVLCIGQIRPNEQQEGAIFQLDTLTKMPVAIIDKLKRPVHFSILNDEKGVEKGMVICEYGYQKGQLSYFKKGQKQKTGDALSNFAGASKAISYDFNKDGLQDIAALMAQGNEGINIYYGTKEGGFTEKQVLQFPPVYGSCDMQLVDFNKDGNIDIVYTNGDNDDFSLILKPYHGVRVYLNDGKDNFTEGVFYPMYGAFQARAADFDLDGDMDIVMTSFFPSDKTKAEAHFLYLEQTKSMQFKPYTFKQATEGKWMTMDIGDADGDGDTDILLGTFAVDLASEDKKFTNTEKLIPFLLLENKAK